MVASEKLLSTGYKTSPDEGNIMGGAPEMLGMIALSGLTGIGIAQYRKYKKRGPKKPKIAYIAILVIGGFLATVAVLTNSDWADKDDPVGSLILGTIIFSFFLFAGYYPGYLIGQNLELKTDRHK